MDAGHPIFEDQGGTGSGNRWNKWRTSRSCFFNGRTITSGSCPVVKIEDYERTTRPELVGSYERGGFCFVVTGSTQYGRAYADPQDVPYALRYYDELKRRGRGRLPLQPVGRRNVPFSFDYSFNYYPLTYDRPGPEIVIYRLDGGECARMRRLVALGVVCGLLAVGVPNLIVWLGGRTPVTTDVAKVPHAQAALVLGAQVYRDGRPSIMLADRIDRRRGALQGRPRGQAAALRRPLRAWTTTRSARCGGCCSRRASRRRTSSPTTRASTRGTPRSAPGGCSTSRARSSSRRASTWPAPSTTRAAPGLKVTGFVADRREYGRVMGKLRVREAAARVKTMGDVVTGADPHFLGAEIPITGDGRVSWGD